MGGTIIRIYDVYQAILHDLHRMCQHYVNEHYDIVWDDGVCFTYEGGDLAIDYCDSKSLETKTIVVELVDLLEWADEHVK